MFHNFHKHTITLLKKCCRFGVNTFRNEEHGQAATALWQAFVKTKSANKKVFNIIFGFPSNSPLESEINLLAAEFKDFRNVKNKCGVESVVKAQECIRAKVAEEVNKFPKEALRVSCRMANFEMFYAHFCRFIVMAKEGETNKRLVQA
jgi:hypothetical protein